ncbi:hypothetical protein BO71DRAFT_438922 [Aspergillus ellipticus CBS 707.79]|uniref:Kynureninase n=1 Tax=Aspergillus ellipticus CBS 707.79 TaxID=1448320 RepID=A0A319DIA4_9EURO|nr:hypothetical protein BO71DRAFT_438922 [Aspergillus ellipticus CBS 707.79]
MDSKHLITSSPWGGTASNFSPGREFARLRDRNDPLSLSREQFLIPTIASLTGSAIIGQASEPGIYFSGNQIGLQPRQVPQLIEHHLRTWALQGMYGLAKSMDRSPLPTWGEADQVAARLMAPIVGGKPHEVPVMGNLTANLHALLASFYRPLGERTRIILEREAFSSDYYAVQSQIQWHGLDGMENIVLIEPICERTLALSTAKILSVIDENASSAALIILSGVQYLTGQVLDMKLITSHAHRRGVVVGWDLAHAVGNIELCLHDWEVDFAVWCNYKYMNAGPGAIGSIFVHEKHGQVDQNKGIEGYRPRLAGWWGNDMTSRFAMQNEFAPNMGAAGYQLSNPSVLDTVTLIASLEVFNQVGMSAIRQKYVVLTGYLDHLLRHLEFQPFEIMTSPDPSERGAQLSLLFDNKVILDRIMARLKGKGIVVAQKQDVMRVAPVPLYNTFTEMWRFVDELHCALESFPQPVSHEPKMNILLFGDQSSDSFTALNNAQILERHIVQTFLAEANLALRSKILQLPRPARQRLPDLSLRANALQDWIPRATTHSVLRPVLTAAAQITEFLHYVDTRQSLDPSNHITLGSCTGLLVGAAATAASACLTRWIPLAMHVVHIAFRIGVHTSTVGEGLTRVDATQNSWSSVVSGELCPEVLAEFHKSTGIPVPLKCYISAKTLTSTTISGPPQTLRKLFSSATFRDKGCSPVTIPVFAPYHAAHLHCDADLDWILGVDDPATQHALSRYTRISNLISTSNGRPIDAKNMSNLLRKVIYEILNDVLRWDSVLHEVATLVPAQDPVTVNNFGSSYLGKSLVSATLDSQSPVEDMQKSADKSKIAIVGMSGRFPGANNTDELWNILQQGLDVYKTIPHDRFNVATHVNPSGKKDNTSATPYGCFLEEPGLFDPSFFHMSPREATVTDPMQRLALVCAYEALEMSGYVSNRTPSSMLDRAGTFYGQTIDDYRDVNASQNIDPFYVTGGLRPFGPGRINYHYKFTGPSYSIDTACSSSLAAIHIACSSLRSRECDMAVTGGTNVITGSDMYAGLSRGQFLSKTGSCKTFDQAADGYCRADTVGTVILKRLEDAQADKDPILGVILASATNHSSLANSITQPHGPTQELLYRKVLAEAGISPFDIDFVEMHGTGTQIGDSTEMCSVSNILGDVNRPEPLYVCSIKANIGHSEAAAGVTAMIKGLLMFQQNTIPAHIGVKGQLNLQFPRLDGKRILIPRQNEQFLKKHRRRRMLINNFGAAGGNTALLMEEPPQVRSVALVENKPAYAIAVSAKSSVSLIQNKERLLAYLARNPDVSISDLSYTTTSRRPHYCHRFITISSTVEGVKEVLSSGEDSTTANTALVFAFTGQGSIYSGAACDLFSISRQFRSTIIQFDALAKAHGLPSFRPLLDPTQDLAKISTVQAQVGQVCIQMALCHLYESWGITPQATVGHSLGEYAALYAAGVLTASDTILAVGRRAQLMEKHCTPGSHTMLAVRAPHKTAVQDMVQSTEVEIACINGPNDVVLSGPVDGIRNAASALSSKGIRSIPLPVPFACHSAQLDPILEPFQMVAKSLDFHAPRVPLLSPLLGSEISQAGVIDGKYLVRHLRQTVDFVAALESSSLVSTESRTQFLEFGPHPICAGMIRNVIGQTAITSLQKGVSAWKAVAESVGALYLRGLDIDWEQYNQDVAPSSTCLPTLPAYAFKNRNYWIDHRNDWALTKGNTVPVSDSSSHWPGTASVQRVVRESLDDSPAQVEFASDLTHPVLRDVIIGHAINGVGLCPSENVNIDFCTDPAADTVSTVYAKCKVLRDDTAKVHRQWQSMKHFVTSRIGHLQSMSGAHRLYHGMAYRIFGGVVHYSERFHGMDEIPMDSNHHEAVATVSFKVANMASDFLRNPHWIDNITQLSGFVLNANETVDSSKTVYISNGWDSLHVAADLSDRTSYTVYVKMDPNENSSVSGDLYILDGEEVIGVATGVRFQGVPRPLLQLLLNPSKGLSEPGANYSVPVAAALSKSTSKYGSGRPLTPPTSDSESLSEKSPPEEAQGSPKAPRVSHLVIRVLCEELGINIEDLDNSSTLAELDVDSLMSLTVIGRLRESFFLGLPSTFLQNSMKLQHLRQSLEERDPTPSPHSNSPRACDKVPVPSNHRATSILLQGSIQTSTQSLFLFPGGFGTSSTFGPMPSINPNLAVFGLNSAFAHHPEQFTISISEMAALYVAEIQRRQPHGPLSFLGYSVGGIIAYEASRQLIVAGEPVNRLYLVDSPCPLVIPPMPPNLIKFLDTIDRFSGKKKTAKEHEEPVKPMGSLHVTKTLISLESYMPSALPPGCRSPRTTYYVAKQGVNNQSTVKLPDVSERDRRVMTWLLEDRTELGGTGDGWEMLVDPAELKIVPIEGTHFSIMKEPEIVQWANELRSSYE